MIFDKCGGMAVLGLMVAVAKLKLPINVVGILSAAENMPGGRAYRPGDILRMYNGVTVEVTDTDAEGRLVLGDALAWGIETYKPAAVVDLATLTAGVADTDKELPYYARGATGWGVRTLVEWVSSRVAPVEAHVTPRPAGG